MNVFQLVSTIAILLISKVITLPVEDFKDPDFLECSNRTTTSHCSCSLANRTGYKQFQGHLHHLHLFCNFNTFKDILHFCLENRLHEEKDMHRHPK